MSDDADGEETDREDDSRSEYPAESVDEGYTGEGDASAADLAPDADAAGDMDPLEGDFPEGHPAEEGLSPEDVDIDPDEVDIDDLSELSNEELLALSGGGYVDEEGNATAFGEGDDAGPAEPPGPGADPAEPTAEETAANLSKSLDENAQDERSTQEELFTDEWVAANTDFEDVGAFFAAEPLAVEPGEGLWDVPTERLDAHAAEHTEYDTWEDLSAAAGDDWLASKLDDEDLSGL
jgi:hypothetical protein